MDKTTAIEKIKVLLGIETKQNFAEVKLKDGTIMRYEGDMPIVGMPVTVVTAEGELPAPDGKYEMEDGSILDVQGGIVSNIVPKEEAAEPSEGALPSATEGMKDENGKPHPTKVVTTKETVFASQEEIEAVKAEFSKKFEALEVLISENKKENEELKVENVKLKKQSEDVLEIVKQIADEPAVESLSTKKDTFNKVAYIKEQKKGFKDFYDKLSK